jgi:hypothetical protein
VRTFAPICLLVVLLAGCAGSVSLTHSLAKTRTCLEQKGATVTRPKGDFVATTASRGTIRAYLHGQKGNFVTLSFGADPTEAQAIADGYNRFHGKNIGVTDILFADKNVTLLWKQHPTSEDAGLVSGCLK